MRFVTVLLISTFVAMPVDVGKVQPTEATVLKLSKGMILMCIYGSVDVSKVQPDDAIGSTLFSFETVLRHNPFFVI